MHQLIDVVTKLTSKRLAESLERAQIALAEHVDAPSAEAFMDLGELKDAISEDNLGKCWFDTPVESCEAPAIRTLDGMSFCAKHFLKYQEAEQEAQRETKQNIKHDYMRIMKQLSDMGEA